MPNPLPDSLLVDLLARMLADRASVGLRPLADYQALFPGFEAAIDAEYRLLQAGPAPDAPGDEVERKVGPYRLLRQLGRGGQGTVWLALDERLQRQVALKIVPRSPLVEDLAPRFRREAQVAGRLDHPGLCAVYDVGHDEAVAWIALRYVEGETLAQRLAKGPLPRESALRLLERAARALHVAHEAGVLHRDVKPANLMITPTGEAVVLDFGVARPREDGPPLTLTGQALGTPAYMAPEELRSGPEADRRADVWSLGVTLYEALSARRPFEAATREALVHAILHDEPAPLPGLPRDLSVVLATALCKEPDGRYQSALDLAEDLRRVRTLEPILARPASPALRLWRWCRRRPALAGSLGVLALVIVGALVTTSLLLADTRRALDDTMRLSDLKVTQDLLARQDELWPAVPERAGAMEQWLISARAVLAREPLHRLSHLPEQGAARDWMVEQLGQLLETLPKLAEAAKAVEHRLTFAHDVDRLTLEEPAGAWAAATAAVAADPRFLGLKLLPQRGLLPLGPDPGSGLQEFAVLQMGQPPVRDADGRLVLDEGSAAVLVLVPGGATHLGTDKEHDPWCGDWDGPRVDVQLDPYFIGKHEVTQAQWSRHGSGDNPSHYTPPWPYLSPEHPTLHPVECMTQGRAERFAHQLGLELPTEAQWEHAARAGADTPWWTGDRPESLEGGANVLDRHAHEAGGDPTWEYEMWLDDGWSVHAPIGSFRANAFGLHDVAGNVAEWCRDAWEDWERVPPRPGDGLAMGTAEGATFRGGSFADLAVDARPAARKAAPRDDVSGQLGLRLARALSPRAE